MTKICVRFNKTRGQSGRGSIDHVWRVFEEDQEYICKNVEINVPSHGEKTGEDWSICCDGILSIDHVTSTVIINKG